MKVIFDYQCFGQHVGGISRCFCELTKNMPNDVDASILVKESNNVYLHDYFPEMGYNHFDNEVENIFPIQFKGRRCLYNALSKLTKKFPSFENVNMKYTEDVLKSSKFDIFHATLYNDYFLQYLNTTPFLITVHDMLWELFPTEFPEQSERKKKLCFLADHIIAVSENTKNDLMRLWNIPENKISVIYHGAPVIKESYSNPLGSEKYFLYVGRRQGYKNFDRTLIDFAIFCKNHSNVKLVCVGSKFLLEEERQIQNLNLGHMVIQISASDTQLYALYQNALAFIFPSIYEGFGIPILESFSNNCICLLNDTSCFPEIGGDAALYFHSERDRSNLAELLERVYLMPENEIAYWKKKSRDRAELFSWKNSAEQLACIYRSLVR